MTNYPDSQDNNLTIPSVSGSTQEDLAISALRDAIFAMEKEFGIRPSGVYSDIRARFDILEARINDPASPTILSDGYVNSPLFIVNTPQAITLSISDGYGFPTEHRINGSLFLRADGYANDDLYIRRDGYWKPIQTDPFVAAGDLSGNYLSQNVIKLRNKSLNSSLSSINSSQDGYVLTWNNSDGYWLAQPSFVANTDLSGTKNNQTVIGLQNRALSSISPIDGYTLVWSSSNNYWRPDSLNLSNTNTFKGLLPDGYQAAQSMGGDISGITSASTVNKIKGKSLATALSSIGSAQDGYALIWVNGSSEWQSLPVSGSATGPAGGDLSGTYPNPTVSKINNTTITTSGGSLITGQVLRVTGSTTSDWGPLNLSNTNSITGVLPDGYQAAQTMTGDVTGTTASSVVAKVNGITITGTPAIGATLRATSMSAASWGQLDLADTDAITGILPIGNQANQTMAGDVSGNTGASIVDKIKGTTITTAGGALAVGAVLRTTAAGTADWGALNLADMDAITGILPDGYQAAQSMGGDISGTTAASVVDKIKGTTITTAGGALAVGAVLRTTAAGTADWGTVDLADTDAVTGVLPTGNQASQSMVGDVSGTTGASTVDKLKGKSLASALSSLGSSQDGYALVWVNGSTEWQALRVTGATSKTRIVRNITTDANYTAIPSDYIADIMEFTDTGVVLTGNIDIDLPNVSGYEWTVFNNVGASRILTFKVNGQTGVPVADGKKAIIYCDGTDIVRATPDT